MSYESQLSEIQAWWEYHCFHYFTDSSIFVKNEKGIIEYQSAIQFQTNYIPSTHILFLFHYPMTTDCPFPTGQPVPAPHSHPKRCGPRRIGETTRIYVQWWGEHSARPASCLLEDRGEPEDQRISWVLRWDGSGGGELSSDYQGMVCPRVEEGSDGHCLDGRRLDSG